MNLGKLGRLASRQNLLSGAPRFGLPLADANNTIDEMKAVVEEYWCVEIRGLGGSEEDCETVSGAFLYPGFEFKLDTVD